MNGGAERERERGIIYAELEELIERRRGREGGADRKQTSSVIYAELRAPTEASVCSCKTDC